MNLKKYLAKSSGEDIITHTDIVINNAKKLSKTYNVSKSENDLLVFAATLHDIGKLVGKIQDFFRKNDSKTDDKLKFSHNIIGWYFIVTYVNLRDNDKIANLVLWHHANYDDCSDLNIKMTEISKSITKDDLNAMIAFCNHYGIPLHEYGIEDYDSKTQFYELDNLLRSILITSDVCASNNTDVDNLFNSNSIDYSELDETFASTIRTQHQLSIVDEIKSYTTTLMNAPTGFGKSVVGILRAMPTTKNVLWVLPTNTMAESIYDDVVSDLQLMGIHIDIELYLTGKRIKSNNNLDEFSSKLIMTNMDNFLKPSVSNNYGARCLMIYDCFLIIDEPQAYGNMTSALNALYNDIMDKRHNQLNATTLILTATRPSFRFLNKGGQPITYLPSKSTHYDAVHNDTFELRFHDTLPTHLMNNEFIHFSHVVDDVQRYYKGYDGLKMISHGRYLDEDKDYRKNLVLSNYGKNGERIPYGVFTNQLLTTSCDYSVKTMFIKCPSLYDFGQALGRINRWGGMAHVVIHILLEKSKSDKYFIGSDDENKLQELFIFELRQRFEGVQMILNDFYSFFTYFIEKYDDLFTQVSIYNLVKSKNMLKKVYSKKNKNKLDDIKVANGNKLRKTAESDGIFIYVKCVGEDRWETINFNINNSLGKTKTFDENEKTYLKQLKIVKTFKGYNKHKKITPELIFKESIYYDTPYPVFNYSYDKELGLIKNDLFL